MQQPHWGNSVTTVRAGPPVHLGLTQAWARGTADDMRTREKIPLTSSSLAFTRNNPYHLASGVERVREQVMSRNAQNLPEGCASSSHTKISNILSSRGEGSRALEWNAHSPALLSLTQPWGWQRTCLGVSVRDGHTHKQMCGACWVPSAFSQHACLRLQANP